jgi:hypothetical protein
MTLLTLQDPSLPLPEFKLSPGEAALRPGRLKLWELEHGYHCSIVGTCLGFDDLSALIRKLGLGLAHDANDYDVHGYFVQQCAQRGPVAKAMHKRLERCYAAEVRRFARIADAQALAHAWSDVMAAGRSGSAGVAASIPGAYWALLTHRQATRALKMHAYGEVHMLSHLMGASNRHTVQRARELEGQCREFEERLARNARHAEEALAQRDRRIAELERLLGRRVAAPKLDATGVDMRASGARAGGRMAARLDALERRLKAERARARAAERRLAELRPLPRAVHRAKQAGEDMPESGCTPAAPDPMPRREPEVRLEGRRLLYVGGRNHLVPYLRALVERAAGALLHHDGGIDDSSARLEGLVSQVDAVYCPVDCVSHDACLKLKSMCRRRAKPFVPLRSASLSSFAQALGAA